MLRTTFLLAVIGLLTCAVVADAGDKKVRVVIIDGQNNHQWPLTTPIMKKALEDTGRFTVEISTSPKRNQEKLIPADWQSGPFPPDLSKFDVIVSNYNGASWPKDFNDALDAQVKAGKIGLVIVHAANNAFGGWKEYNQMIGMGWRGNKGGDRIYLDDSAKLVRIESGKGDGTGHRYTGPFKMIVRDQKHPVTKGMPLEWMHAQDELYDNLRGPAENVHILATAISPPGKGTGVHEPMIFTISYGKGRVFHTPMGHDVRGMRCIGFQTTLTRGTEWAATGSVTIPIPSNFPTADKESSVSK